MLSSSQAKAPCCSGLCSSTTVKNSQLHFLLSPSRRGCLDLCSRPEFSSAPHLHSLKCHTMTRVLQGRTGQMQFFTTPDTTVLNTHLMSRVSTQWNLGQIYRTLFFLKSSTKFCDKELLYKGEWKLPIKEQFIKTKLATSVYDPNVIPAGTVPQLPSESDYLSHTGKLFPYKSPLLNAVTSPKGSDSSTQLT